MIWYRPIGLDNGPQGPWTDPTIAAQAIQRWLNHHGQDLDTSNVLVNGYTGRIEARNATPADQAGTNGCATTSTLAEFLNTHGATP